MSDRDSSPVEDWRVRDTRIEEKLRRLKENRRTPRPTTQCDHVTAQSISPSVFRILLQKFINRDRSWHSLSHGDSNNLNRCWINCYNPLTCIANEISCIERQNMRQTI